MLLGKKETMGSEWLLKHPVYPKIFPQIQDILYHKILNPIQTNTHRICEAYYILLLFDGCPTFILLFPRWTADSHATAATPTHFKHISTSGFNNPLKYRIYRWEKYNMINF